MASPLQMKLSNARPSRVIGIQIPPNDTPVSFNYPFGLFVYLTGSPICFEDLSESTLEDTVYCRAMCGNNLHKECFNQWARSKRQEVVQVTCGNTHNTSSFNPQSLLLIALLLLLELTFSSILSDGMGE
jgi:hypothetical protein